MELDWGAAVMAAGNKGNRKTKAAGKAKGKKTIMKPKAVMKKPSAATKIQKPKVVAKRPASKKETMSELFIRLNSQPEPKVRIPTPKASTLKMPQTLLLGSACSGMETASMAAEEIEDRTFKLCFWVEKDKSCQKFLRANFTAEHEYDDVWSDSFLTSAPFTHGFTAGHDSENNNTSFSVIVDISDCKHSW